MIKLIVFDLDGVFTDGKIYVISDGKHFKSYTGKDTYALKLLKEKGIKTGLLTAHDSPCLDGMIHLVPRMDYLSKGKYEKLGILDGWRKKEGLVWEEVGYIGDDLPDLPCIEKVGFSGCPADAIEAIKEKASYICKNRGGDGAVREFVEFILKKKL